MTIDGPVRVIIADDHALFRQGLKSLLQLHSSVMVVAEIEHASDLGATVERTPCDLLLLDLRMERTVLADIATLAGRVAVVVVTASERSDDALAVIRAGARGLVFKRFAIETLMSAIRAVMEGQLWLPPAVQGAVTAQLLEPAGATLTRRERDIVRQVALGLHNSEVAERLGIGEVTVKSHLNNIFQKLGVRDRVELARYAIRVGIVGVHEREG